MPSTQEIPAFITAKRLGCHKIKFKKVGLRSKAISTGASRSKIRSLNLLPSTVESGDEYKEVLACAQVLALMEEEDTVKALFAPLLSKETSLPVLRKIL